MVKKMTDRYKQTDELLLTMEKDKTLEAHLKQYFNCYIIAGYDIHNNAIVTKSEESDMEYAALQELAKNIITILQEGEEYTDEDEVD